MPYSSLVTRPELMNRITALGIEIEQSALEVALFCFNYCFLFSLCFLPSPERCKAQCNRTKKPKKQRCPDQDAVQLVVPVIRFPFLSFLQDKSRQTDNKCG
jgi:hypothetical protein